MTSPSPFNVKFQALKIDQWGGGLFADQTNHGTEVLQTFFSWVDEPASGTFGIDVFV